MAYIKKEFINAELSASKEAIANSGGSHAKSVSQWIDIMAQKPDVLYRTLVEFLKNDGNVDDFTIGTITYASVALDCYRAKVKLLELQEKDSVGFAHASNTWDLLDRLQRQVLRSAQMEIPTKDLLTWHGKNLEVAVLFSNGGYSVNTAGFMLNTYLTKLFEGENDE